MNKKIDQFIEEKDFEEIYDNTYNILLKFIIIKCNKIEDVNDIIQETYIELLRIIRKKKLTKQDNIEGYVLGIAKNVLKRHFSKKKDEKILSYYSDIAEDTDISLSDLSNIEEDFITKENADNVWKYLKQKEVNIIKIFYLYYVEGLHIEEIAKELNLTDSNVKNKLYRTIKELQKYLKKEVC